jgi:hypothetical protein
MRYVAKLAAVSVAAACCYGSGDGKASAQTALNRADILGIRLGDGIDAVKQTISDAFPGSQTYDVKTTLTVPEHKEDYQIGTLFDITTAEDKSANESREDADKQEADAKLKGGLSTGSPLDKRVASTGDYGRERIAVIWYAGANGEASKVFGIGRAKEFLASGRPLVAETVSSLIEKYGQPTQISKADPYGRTQYLFWASNANIDRRKCFKEDRYSLLYEDAGFYNIQPFERGAQSLRTDFLGKTNNCHSHNPLTDVSQCGTVLRVQLVLSDNLSYLMQLNESLVDLTEGQRALTKLSDDFFAQVSPPQPGPKPKL